MILYSIFESLNIFVFFFLFQNNFNKIYVKKIFFVFLNDFF